MNEQNTTPLDISAPLRRRDGGSFEIWKVVENRIIGRVDGKGIDWDFNGRALFAVESIYDLLPAPRRIKGWVNVYYRGGSYSLGSFLEKKEYADSDRDGNWVGCIQIDQEEEKM